MTMEGEGGEKKDIRRPMNAFLIFCKRHRSVVREKNPDMDNRSVTRVLGDLWANLGEEKATYTNLAKQYKDAFMKANPNYKWHSSDKSQGSSGKSASKPTNSRVIKNVPELAGDGIITPGKLADPEKMGGLNLLLMADKETRDVRTTSSAISGVTAMQLSVSATQASNFEGSDTPNSALLQLAEMCTSELHSSGKEIPLGRSTTQSKSQAQGTMTSGLQQSVPSQSPIHHPMRPPKKRARHWSLTEPDGEGDIPNDDELKDHHSRFAGGSASDSNLSPLNLSMPKQRCISGGSVDDKFTFVEKCRSATGRRRTSSSATESVPSPTMPYGDGMDDADSPVFTPDCSKTGSYAFAGKRNDIKNGCDMPSAFSSVSSKNQCHFPEQPPLPSQATGDYMWNSPKPSDEFEQQQRVINPQLFNPQPAIQKAARSQHPTTVGNQSQTSVNLPATRSLLGHGPPASEVSGHQGQSTDLLSSPVSSAPKLESNHKWPTGEIKPEKNNPDFYQWREPGKSKPKTTEPPASLKFVQSSADNVTSPILSRLVQPISTTSTASIKQEESIKPVAAKPGPLSTGDFASVLSEGRIASLLNSPDMPPFKVSKVENTLHSGQLSMVKNTSTSLDDGGSKGLLTANQRKPELTIPSVKPPSCCPPSFSEGKLKKKWTERSLVEAKMEENLNQQRDKDSRSRDVNTTSTSSPSLSGLFRGLDSEPRKCSDGNAIMTSSCDGNTLSLKYPPIDSKLFQSSDGTSHSGTHSRLILNQPLDSLKASAGQGSFGLSSGNTSSALQLSLAQKQLAPKGTMAQSVTGFGAVNIKSERELPNQAGSYGESKLFATQQEGLTFSQMGKGSETIATKSESKISFGKSYHSKGLDVGGNNNNGALSQNLSDKNILNQITACGKKFVDHIVEQLFKSDFACEKSTDSSLQTGETTGPTAMSVKTEPGASFRQEGQSVDKMDKWIKREGGQEYKVLTASSLVEKVVREVCGSSVQKTECSSCSKSDQTDKTASKSQVKEETPSSVASDCPQISNTNRLVHSENSNSFETYRQTSSPTNDVDNHSQRSAQTPESCEQSDHNDDMSMQPVRKSRRANRGQKYQELIKEGFIQPSRERMAARNAERQHGRSFGTREEYEKLENRRTLKRSASERDTSSVETPSMLAGGAETSNDASDTEKRYATGDFDLEKEIESLPVCSIDQLGKKKSHRRRCDSDTSTPAMRHRSNSDASIVSSSSTVNNSSVIISHGQRSPGTAKVEVQVNESGCPAPHIPIPKEERPAEPVTGSRKRKARRHCITRISVLEEDKSPVVLPKKFCSQPQQLPPSSSSSSSSPRIMDNDKDSIRMSGCQRDSRNQSSRVSETSVSHAVKEGEAAAKKTPFPQPLASLLQKSLAPQLVSNTSLLQNPTSSTPHLTAALGQNSSTLLPISNLPGNHPKEVKKTHPVSTSVRKEKKNAKVQKAQLPIASVSVTLPESTEFQDSSPKCLWNGKPLLNTPMPGAGTKSSVDAPSLKPPVNHSKGNSVNISSSVVSNLLRTISLPSTNPPATLAHSDTRKVEKQGSFVPSQKKEPKAKTSKARSAEQGSADTLVRKQRKTVKRDQGKKSVEGGTIRKNNKKASQLISPPSASELEKNTIVKSESVPQNNLPSFANSSVPSLVSRLFGTSVNSPDFVKEIVYDQTSPLLKSPTKMINLPSHSDTIHLPSRVTTINLNDTVTQLHSGSSVPHVSSSKLFPSAFPATSTINLASEPRAPLLLQPPSSQQAASKAGAVRDSVSNSHCANVSPNTMVTSSSAVGYGHSKLWSPTKLVSYPSTIPQSLHQNQAGLSSSPAMSSTASAVTITPSLQPSTSLTLSAQCPATPSTPSLTTCTPSASTDIVNYTVISSSSVMEAGSPHMIGSPHLPESPSVAVV